MSPQNGSAPERDELRRRVLDCVARAGALLGVRRFGCCALADLSELLPSRKKPRVEALAQEGGGAVVLLLPYYAGEFPGRNVSRYALADDYHAVALAILSQMIAPLEAAFPGRVFLPLVDSSPIPEVEAGVLAGLGFRGKNGQLITPWFGSLAFLCEIVTDLPLPSAAERLPDGCGDCRRCLRACPTGALSPDGLDLSRCRSQITQKKGALTPWEEEQVRRGGFAWGCDCCTNACPYNREPALTPVRALGEHLTPVVTRDNLDTLLPVKSYGWRGKATILRNLEIIDEER